MTHTENTQKSFQVFQNIFSNLQDPRRQTKGNFSYSLNEVLFLTISAVISGMDNWISISNFGKTKQEWLRKFLPYSAGIPSHDILGDIFSKIDPLEFSNCFSAWINTLHEITKGEVISIDGKTICNSDEKSIGKKAIHVVSAYTSAYNLCLGQQAVDEKSNEITAIPLLLDLLFIKDAIITIDAMGCQKQIASKIIEKEANYVLMVKDNQKQLKEDIQLTFSEKIQLSTNTKNDLGHGRIETRTCYATNDLTLIRASSDWKSIKSLVKIESKRTDKRTGKTSVENRYYISSLPADAEHLNHVVRKHWGVENKLHWVLDVVFKEDLSLKKKGYSALNYNIISKIAINLLDKDTQSKKSKPIKRQTAAMDDDYREKLLNF